MMFAMFTRGNKLISLCNVIAGLLLMMNVISHILQIGQSQVPGSNWGMTTDRWKYILIQQTTVGIGLVLFGALAWLRPAYARVTDLLLTIPKLYYGFGFVLWARLSGNTFLLASGLCMLASVALQPVMWLGGKNKARAAAA